MEEMKPCGGSGSDICVLVNVFLKQCCHADIHVWNEAILSLIFAALRYNLKIGKLGSVRWLSVTWHASISCTVQTGKGGSRRVVGVSVSSRLARPLRTLRCFVPYPSSLPRVCFRRSGCVCTSSVILYCGVLSGILMLFLILNVFFSCFLFSPTFFPLLCNWRLLQSEILSCQILHSASFSTFLL